MPQNESIDVIDDLILYVVNQKTAASIDTVFAKISPQDFRVVCIKILEWMKSQNRIRYKNAMAIDRKYDWCNNLEIWISTDSNSAKIFEIAQEEFSLNRRLNELERAELYKYVDDNYHPPLMT